MTRYYPSFTRSVWRQKIKNQGAYEYMHTLALVLEPRYLASMVFSGRILESDTMKAEGVLSRQKRLL